MQFKVNYYRDTKFHNIRLRTLTITNAKNDETLKLAFSLYLEYYVKESKIRNASVLASDRCRVIRLSLTKINATN